MLPSGCPSMSSRLSSTGTFTAHSVLALTTNTPMTAVASIRMRTATRGQLLWSSGPSSRPGLHPRPGHVTSVAPGGLCSALNPQSTPTTNYQPLLVATATAATHVAVRQGFVLRPQAGCLVHNGCSCELGRMAVVVGCMPAGGQDSGPAPATFAGRRNRRNRRSPKSDTAAPAPAGTTVGGSVSGAGAAGHSSAGSGPAASAASSPVPAPSPGSGSGSVVGAGSVATAATAVAVAVTAPAKTATEPGDGSESDYEGGSGVEVAGNHIVPFARRQPRALVLDCAYRPINVLTWYRAFHFDYFGKGEVLEYYPPPAVCTTGSGDFPLPAVIRVPQYTADMQDLCSRVACSRRNVMVRDAFCCQYCGSRRDLTIDHVHPVSRGGKETWENLVTACMKCNQRKSNRTLRELGWKLKRQPKEPSPFEIGIVAGISTADILRPPPEWEAYIAPYRERLETYRRAAVEAGLLNLIEEGH